MEQIKYQDSRAGGGEVYDEITRLVQRKGLEPHEAVELGKMLQSSYKAYDDGYLKALLFPEDSENCRIPSKFPLSTALATQTWSFYVNTGESGQGYVALLPLDLAYCTAYRSLANWDGNDNNSGDYTHQYIKETSNESINQYYSNGRVVGASIRCQYIGEAMTESGLMYGSHVMDSTLGRISEDVIENGYYITRGRPHEGMRLAYLPRDEADIEYCALDYKIKHASGDHVVLPKFDYINAPQMAGGQLRVDVFQPFSQDWVDEVGTAQIGANNGPVYFKRPDQYIGQTSKRGQSNTPYQMVIGWVGMPPGKDWIRIDITRHLELIPRIQLRDLISTKKAVADQKTVDIVQHIAEVDERPLSNTVQKHEVAMANHAEIAVHDAALGTAPVRAKAGGSWIGRIMKGLLGEGMKIAGAGLGMIGGVPGKIGGAALGWLGNKIEGGGVRQNASDTYTGAVSQGLVGLRNPFM